MIQTRNQGTMAPETRAAIARCKGHLSASAAATLFGVKEGMVKGIWYQGRGLRTAAQPAWRCGCGRKATGDECACGAPAAWVAADRRIAQEIAALGEVV